MIEIYADYNKEDKALLGKYISPGYETSDFKGIPISLYGKVTRLLPSKDRRIKFRGTSTPGYKRPQTHMIKEFADTFAIYYDNSVVLHLGRPGEKV